MAAAVGGFGEQKHRFVQLDNNYKCMKQSTSNSRLCSTKGEEDQRRLLAG